MPGQACRISAQVSITASVSLYCEARLPNVNGPPASDGGGATSGTG